MATILEHEKTTSLEGVSTCEEPAIEVSQEESSDLEEDTIQEEE